MFVQLWGKSTRLIPALVLATALFGCMTVTPGDTQAGHVKLFDDTISLSAPSGYCLDTKSSQPDGDTPVLIFASCRGLGAEMARLPAIRGILTATVQPKGPEGVLDPSVLNAFFRSERGAQMIAHRADHQVTVHDSGSAQAGYFWLRAEETENTDPDLSPWIWLGMTKISGHNAVLKFYPASDFSGNPLAGEALFHQFMRRNTRK